MKRFYLSLIIIFLGWTACFSQGKVLSNPFGFEMNEPAGWYAIDKVMIAESLKRVELGEERLEKYLDDNEGKQLLFGYVKFKQDTFNGMNPKIEARVVRIRSPKPVTFAEFKPLAESSLRKIASQFSEQRYIVEPSETDVGSIRSIYHISEFSIRDQKGKDYTIRSRTYLIPRGTYLFQISFVDEPKKNDLSAEFDELIKTVKIGK